MGLVKKPALQLVSRAPVQLVQLNPDNQTTKCWENSCPVEHDGQRNECAIETRKGETENKCLLSGYSSTYAQARSRMRCRQRLVNVVLAVAVVVEELEPGGSGTPERSELGLGGHFQVLTQVGILLSS